MSGAPRGIRTLAGGAAVFTAALVLFLVGVQHPDEPVFDEIHYVPAARGILAGDPVVNMEHPPLAKHLIAAGIRVAGDRPSGWRLPGALMASVAAAAVYVLGVQVLGSPAAGAVAAVFALLNGVLFAVARLALLDAYAVGFGFAGLAVLFHASRAPSGRRPAQVAWTFFAGALLGCSAASKWSGIAFVLLGVLLAFTEAPPRGRGAHLPAVLVSAAILIAGACLAYFAAFVPMMRVDAPGFSLSGIVSMQQAMWQYHRIVLPHHDYHSPWWEWPVFVRSQWLGVVAPVDGDPLAMRSVLLEGNAPILLGGLGALAFQVRQTVRHRSTSAARLVLFFAALYLPWAIGARRTTFFYYYLPALLALGLSLADVVVRTARADRSGRIAAALFMAVCVAFFARNFPLRAGWKLTADELQRWYPEVYAQLVK